MNRKIEISILIPTRNEAPHIVAKVEYLRSLRGADNIEILVCDGGSDDNTREAAEGTGARVLLCEPNRGAQLNAGARAVGGEILWFLHADARPHERSLEYLQRVAQKPQVCGGNFQLRFDSHRSVARSFELIARLQRRRGVYYGDSGIWVRREAFELMNRFNEWPLFEDYDFARRLEGFAKRHGNQTEYSPLPIYASARRFEKAPLRVLGQWAKLQFLFSLGVSPEKLAAMYFKPRD